MEQLIESVRKYPCIWKIDCEEYKLNDLKDAAWKEVVKECDLKDDKEARALWKKLRDGHRQALAKKKTVTGQAATSKYKWKYEQQMEFLLPSMQNRPRSTNVIIEEHSSRDSTIQNEESMNDSIEQIYVDVNPPKKKATLVSLLETEQRRRQERSIERDTLRKQILLSSAPKPETALEKFFNSMLLTTQTLSERLQLKVQREIFNIVMEAKEEHLASQPTCSPLTPTNPAVYTYAALSRSPSVLSDYEYSNPVAAAQSSPHLSNQYTSPPQTSSYNSNQYTSSPQTSSRYTDPYTSPPQSNPETNQETYMTLPSNVQSNPPLTQKEHGSQLSKIRTFLEESNFD